MSATGFAMLDEVAEWIGGELAVPEGAGRAAIVAVAAVDGAAAGSLVFAESDELLRAALASGAAGILTTLALGEGSRDRRIVFVRHPKLAFAQAAQRLQTTRAVDSELEPLIHPAAAVHAMARLGVGVRVGACAVIEADVVVGEGTEIGSRVTLCRGTLLGARCVVQSGAVLGGTGFGYVRDPATGRYTLFPQLGRLVIEDDVEIGANTTIDRGALGETRIGRGTKIDNMVHIGHNCRIGEDVVIASMVGISGSAVVENGAVLAGQVGLGDHCRVGPGVIMGGQSGLYPGKSVEGPGTLFAGTPCEPVRDHLRALAKLRRLARK